MTLVSPPCWLPLRDGPLRSTDRAFPRQLSRRPGRRSNSSMQLMLRRCFPPTRLVPLDRLKM
eukprot:659876-Hanusia_phi.AAC.1